LIRGGVILSALRAATTVNTSDAGRDEAGLPAFAVTVVWPARRQSPGHVDPHDGGLFEKKSTELDVDRDRVRLAACALGRERASARSLKGPGPLLVVPSDLQGLRPSTTVTIPSPVGARRHATHGRREIVIRPTVLAVSTPSSATRCRPRHRRVARGQTTTDDVPDSRRRGWLGL